MAATSPFEQRIAALDNDDLMRLLSSRHSVRSYTDRHLEGEARAQIQREIDVCNEQFGLSMQLCLDNPQAFDGTLAHYGSFRDVRNHIALVGPKRPALDEDCGTAGGRVVLLAQSLGLNTCWVALTFRRRASAARIAPGERFVCCMAIGYGENDGASHSVKPIEKLARTGSNALDTMLAWFVSGLKAAQLAPTALNQQRFCFDLDEDRRAVQARTLPTPSCGHIDLGIARLHFELGANTVSDDWMFS